KLQESRAETLVGEDKNSLMESNTLVSNLQTGTSLGHPISILVDESNENWADGTEGVTRTQCRESSNTMAKNNKGSKNLLVYTNENKNGLVAIESTKMDNLKSQLVQMQTSGTNTSHMEAYDSMTNLETHFTSLPNSSYLNLSTIEINSNKNKEFSHRNSEEYSDLDDNETDIQIADLETLLQEEKDQDVSIQGNNNIANKNIDNTQQETEFTLAQSQGPTKQ
ncbi:41448_t:CDS:2, partial [Gigaspora margarita]